MPWTLKSSKTGQEFDFADDVKPEEALQWLDTTEKDAGWGDAAKAFPAQLRSEAVKQAQGIASLLANQPNTAARLAGKAAQGFLAPEAAVASQEVKDTTPANTTLPQQMAGTAAASIALNVPGLLTGAGVASKLASEGVKATQALATGASGALTQMSVGEGAKEFQEQLDASATPGRAALHAAVQTVAEYLPEKFAWTPVMKLLGTNADAGLKKAVASFLFRDVVGEEITTTAEWINRKLSRDPNTTLAELAHEMTVTAGATLISGPLQGGATGIAYRLALKEKVQKDLSERHEPTIAGESSDLPGGALEPKLTVPPEVERARRGSLILEGELPLVGMPENGKAIPRQLPIELQLDGLRAAWDAYSNKNAFDTAEDRIAKKQEFVRRRMEVERELQFDPEGRAFLTSTDEEMNVTLPTIAGLMEDEANRYTALTPRQEEELRVAREDLSTETEVGFVPNVPKDAREPLGIPTAGAANYTADLDQPLDKSAYYGSQKIAEIVGQNLSGRPALQSNGKYDGMLFEDVKELAQPGEVVFFAKPWRKNANAASAIQTLTTDLVKTFLPGYRVFISDFVEKAGVASHAYPIDDKTLVIALPKTGTVGAGGYSLFDSIKDRFTETKELANVVDTMSHEIGHLIHMAHWKGSPLSERVSVANEFHEDLKAAQSMNVKDALARLYSPKTADMYLDEYLKVGGKEQDMFLSPFAKENLPMHANPTYWFNMNEWMAHKTAKYFLTRLGVTSANRSFFQRLIVKFQSFYSRLSANGFRPSTNFAVWLDNVAARESGLGLVMKASEAAEAKTQLVRDGLSPELADVISMVNGSDAAAIRKKAIDLRIERGILDIAESEKKALAQIGSAVSSLNVKDAVAKLKSFSFAKDLATHPLFASGENSLQFLDSVTQLVFKNSTQKVDTKSFTVWAFLGQVTDLQIELDKSSGKLSVPINTHENADASRGAFTVAAFSVLRDLAGQGKVQVLVDDNPMWEMLGAEDGILEIPYFSQEKPVRPPESVMDVAPPELRLPAAFHQLGVKYNLPFFRSTGNSVGRFLPAISRAIGSYQLIKLNEHIPGMIDEKIALRNRMAYRHKWLKRSNETVQEWMFKLPKTESVKLARLLYDESESGKWTSTLHADPNRPGERIFLIAPQEVSRRGLSQKTQEVYSKVRNDFMAFAEEWQKVGLWEIARTELSPVAHLSLAEAMRNGTPLKDFQKIFNAAVGSLKNPVEQGRILARSDLINDAFENWKAKPYMPHTRFGRHGVLVRSEATGKTKFFAGHDSKADALKQAEELRTSFPHDAISTTYIEDVPFMFAGLPPAILESMKTRLGLTQQQLDTFSDVMSKMSHANSFVHRASRKAGIPGHSVDAMRAYADYFRRGSAFIARTKSQPELDDAMKMLKQFIRQQTSIDGEVTDVSNLGRLHDWFTKLHAYLNDPGNEYGEVKSMLALWHFGLNVATATMNTLQVPMVTLPYLASRFGEKRAVKELGRAYKDVLSMHLKKAQLAPDEMAMLDDALSAGFRDESQATVLAQIADGSALTRATAHTAWAEKLGMVNHYAMWMFSKGELLNRDVTLLASYRMQKVAGFHGAFDRNAADFARTVTEDTHNEYSQENRPEIMRGAGGVVFQFMHYVQNMMFLMFGGDQSWWRLLLVQLALAGPLGLPLASDAAQAAKALGRIVFGKDWDVERETREYLHSIGQNPDFYLRGLSSDVFGFDLSKRISLGDVVPGMQALGSHRKFQDVMYNAVGDVGGPAVSLLMNAMKFLSEQDKTSWEALRNVMPTGLKSFGNAAKAFTTGTVKDRSGAVVFEPDTWDVLGMTAGWQPKQVSANYEAKNLEQEKRAFWLTRRQAMLEMWNSIILDRDSDREAVADFMKRLTAYNETAPEPKLMITAQQLRASAKARLRLNIRKEAGLGSSPSMPQGAREIQSTFSENE